VSYHLHPDATPVEHRQPVPLEFGNVRARSDGVGHVRITARRPTRPPLRSLVASPAGTPASPGRWSTVRDESRAWRARCSPRPFTLSGPSD